MEALLVRLAGYSSHFRDPRTNTAKIGLPSRTMRCPPPSTIHGLLMAAKGGWVEPDTLAAGWYVSYASIGIDFQTSQLPQRKSYSWLTGTQKTKSSPVEREFLAYPVLSILALSGVDEQWLRRPANPLSLGRSEDMITEKIFQKVEVEPVKVGEVEGQCLPVTMGFGTIFGSPMYFAGARKPVGMMPRVDAGQRQRIEVKGEGTNLYRVEKTGENFFIWDFGKT
jgi:CRISPR-associated Cas5-like protein